MSRSSRPNPARRVFLESLEDRRLLAVVYNANDAFVAHELGANETNSSFAPWSVGHFAEGSPGGFTAFTASEHTNGFRDQGANKIQGFFVNNNVDVPVLAVNTATTPITTDYGSTERHSSYISATLLTDLLTR